MHRCPLGDSSTFRAAPASTCHQYAFKRSGGHTSRPFAHATAVRNSISFRNTAVFWPHARETSRAKAARPHVACDS